MNLNFSAIKISTGLPHPPARTRNRRTAFYRTYSMKIMKRLLPLLLVLTPLVFLSKSFSAERISKEPSSRDSTAKNYLALGDSYTIGQSVPAAENFPHQLADLLRQNNIAVGEPEIRAVTGWTTGDLISSLRTTPPLLQHYDLVTLLIGVNNQFQGRPITNYETDFRFLLAEAIRYAGEPKKVLVLSIPDYGVTPFAAGSDTRLIAKEINTFNAAQKRITKEAGVQFIDITAISRKGKKDGDLQAADGLHPSGKQYGLWVNKLAAKALQAVQ